MDTYAFWKWTICDKMSTMQNTGKEMTYDCNANVVTPCIGPVSQIFWYGSIFGV